MKSCSRGSGAIDAIAQVGSSVAAARRTAQLAATLVLACAGLTLAVAPASAACVPGGLAIASGSSVICTGTDVTGVGNFSQSNVTVNVEPGASINVGGSAISLSSQNTITNAGTITAANYGIISPGLNNTVTNSGTISAVIGDILTGSGSVTNTSSGMLIVTSPGIGSQQGNGITFTGGSGVTIVNNGTIVGAMETPAFSKPEAPAFAPMATLPSPTTARFPWASPAWALRSQAPAEPTSTTARSMWGIAELPASISVPMPA